MARRTSDFGKVLPTHRWRGESRARRWWRMWRPWLFLTVLLGLWWAFARWGPGEPAPTGTPERVTIPFHRCGTGPGPNCVVDGDTFIMGKRHIRIVGIDAPEIGNKARCPDEARRADLAAAALLGLLNQGPFTLRSPADGLRDDYGRELMHVTRARADGSSQDIAADLIASGAVRRYEFGPRGSWC